MNFTLTPVEARVLGSLVEKEITTPEYYPLSLNAILNAANQKSNRDPVMDLDEDAVRRALHSLSQQSLARSAATDSRVPKFEHRLAEVFNFHRHEIALLCVLLLRGPQTPGELRGRSERMYRFETLDDVQSTIQRLSDRTPPLMRVLPRQPGTKESRYVHLFSADTWPTEIGLAHASLEPRLTTESRISALEAEIFSLRNEVAELRQQLEAFKTQFQ